MADWMAERSSGNGRSNVRRAAAEGLAGGGLAGGVVVVAEGLFAEADAAAAVAVGEDVAALVAFGFGCVAFVHFGLSPHLGVLVQSIQK